MGIEKQGLSDHKFQYLGREKQNELGLNWLDLKARNYDSQLGRFHSIDTKADEAGQENQSIYQYGYNNLALMSDSYGDCPLCFKVGKLIARVSQCLLASSSATLVTTKGVTNIILNLSLLMQEV